MKVKKGGREGALFVYLCVLGSRSRAERAGLRRRIAFANLGPVHRVPPRLEIIGAAVLVVQIISVLPDVVAHQGALAVHYRVVLIRTGLDRELAVLGNGDEH